MCSYPWGGTNDAGRSSKKDKGFDFATVTVKRIVGPALASPDPRQAQSGRFWIG